MLRFMDGFDFYAVTSLPIRYANAAGTANTMTTSGGRFSSGAVQLGFTSFECSLTQSFDSRAAWFVGFAVMFPAFPSGTQITFLRIKDSGNTQLELNVSAANKITITRNGTLLATGTTTVVPSTFYFIEFGVVISSSCSANTVLAKLGGTTEVTVPTSTNCQATANATANQIQLVRDGNFGGTTCVTFDDFYVCDSSGSANNTFLGDVRVETIYPTGAGTHTTFALTGAASNYAAVNEHPSDGDTSYVSSATPGNIDTYTFGSLSSTPTAIFGIQVDLTNRKDDAGSRGAAAALRTAATDYVGPTFPVLDSYAITPSIFETDPNTAAAWTQTEVNALEAGIKVVS